MLTFTTAPKGVELEKKADVNTCASDAEEEPDITKTVELGDLAPLWSIEIVYRQKPSVLVGGVIHTSLGFRIFEDEQTKATTCEILDQYAGHIVIGFNNLELAKKAQKFLEEGIK